jgi:glucose uptake protein
MFVPELYAVALFMLIVSMFGWGSWANCYKVTPGWRFELFYWDYVWGALLIITLLALTMGRTDPLSPDSFLNNLRSADSRHIFFAFLGGAIWNVANIILVAAIAIAGMAVAFPVGIGLAIVIGSVSSYFVTPVGNPWLLFGGVGLVCLGILFDAMAYRRLSGDTKVSTKGILLSLLAGVGVGAFFPFVAKSLVGENHLGPYGVCFVFMLGVVVSNIFFNYLMMRRPVVGPPVTMGDYFRGTRRAHLWGLLAGIIWGTGTVANFVVSYAKMVGPATSYAIGQGATMVSAIWGVFLWKEFRGGGPEVKRMLALMFLFFILGLTSVALAPVVAH